MKVEMTVMLAAVVGRTKLLTKEIRDVNVSLLFVNPGAATCHSDKSHIVSTQ